MISNGRTIYSDELSDDEKQQMGFVQFHPSYDYTDFVEGLRPKLDTEGNMSFELKDGSFKKFIKLAMSEHIRSSEHGLTVPEMMEQYFNNLDLTQPLETIGHHNQFFIEDINVNYGKIHIKIPANERSNQLDIKLDDIKGMLESDPPISSLNDATTYLRNQQYARQEDSYAFAIVHSIKQYYHFADDVSLNQVHNAMPTHHSPIEIKKYVFIIDEINRGEISKIFGELFFAIDPDYRGPKGRVLTQYSNLYQQNNW